MKFRLILLISILIFGFGLVSAEFNLDVEKADKGSVIISELNNPAIFNFIIDNDGPADFAEIYSLVGVSMTPKGTFSVPTGKSEIEVRAYLGDELRKREGIYSFEYQIKGQYQGIFKDKLSIRVVSLKNVFSLEDVKIHPDNESAELSIKNNVNSNLENVNIHFISDFFDAAKEANFKPFETVKLEVPIKKEGISKLLAGKYDMSAEVSVKDIYEKFNGVIDYLDKEDISTEEDFSGLIIIDSVIIKMNKGNVPVTVKIEMKKDIISRLFTSYSSEPLRAEREGLVVRYFWEKELNPGEFFSVTTTTNYTFPIILIILIVVIVLLVRVYSMTALVMQKSVSFVKTKGGEFALRIKIRAKARKNVSNIEIIDRLPHMAKLYEKFGVAPHKIDHNTGKLFWNIPHLNRGEERNFSYIIYSKLRAVGKFELPSTTASFEYEGDKKKVVSNKAYFVSESVEEEA